MVLSAATVGDGMALSRDGAQRSAAGWMAEDAMRHRTIIVALIEVLLDISRIS
jgi:hypothetical protein